MNQELRIRNKKFRVKPIIHYSLFIIRKSVGFTLIELLIVIVIIGVLATILLANFIGVRQRSRDAQRKADLRQIQGAIELYKADQNTYPVPGTYGLYSVAGCSTSSSLTGGTVTYMQKLPCDSRPPTSSDITGMTSGNYGYTLSTNTYNLYACLENLNDTDPNAQGGGGTTCGTDRNTYKLTNP